MQASRPKPLAGRRILVTRAAHQASDLADRLSALGAAPIVIPAIEIAPPGSYAALDAALAALDRFDVVAFTSANAVEAFQQRAQRLGITPAPRSVAVVGPATQRAARLIGLAADVVPPAFTAESLARTLSAGAHGRRFLLVLAEDAPPTLSGALTEAGGQVMIAAAYRNRIPQASLTAAAELFAAPAEYPDAVTFTSASTARNLVALLQAAKLALPERVTRASIGPITSRALGELGLPPHIEAAEATIPALVDALTAYFRGAGDQSCIAPQR